MFPFRRAFAFAGLVLMMASVVGCSNMATAPVPLDSTTSSSAAVVSTDDPAPLPSTNATSASTNGLIGSLGSVVGKLVGLVVRTLNVVGSLGGSLTNGRWRVDVPPNAIQGNASIGLGVQTLLSTDCQLEIAPASANHFAVPVQLTVDCRSVPSDQLANYVIYWFNPATARWVPVEGSRVDLTRKTVSAPLAHFSRYAVGPAGGKAGW